MGNRIWIRDLGSVEDLGFGINAENCG